ncbi:hypothetical protein OsI_28038 [Oryza sativa Indica Group]|uniref:Uncharacterized protein n=1 Tax=Oryza sativa subsp. indica TaxID=39946 RepID=B8BBD0_ORYSI|nr:hypothetical protein OsI_28038 [Oryza sativa Indica Group]
MSTTMAVPYRGSVSSFSISNNATTTAAAAAAVRPTSRGFAASTLRSPATTAPPFPTTPTSKVPPLSLLCVQQ